MTKIDNEARVVYLKTIAIVGTVLVIVTAWLWWNVVYNSPKNVFDAMLSNSLQTFGVTRSSVQQDQTGKIEQRSQAHFGPNNYVDVRSTISQEGEAGKTKIETQTLADGKDNYVRYLTIDIPSTDSKPAPDFSPLIKVWGKQQLEDGQDSVFSEAVFGAVLFGYLPHDKQQELINKINTDNLYDIDFSNVDRIKHNGKSAYAYTAKIKTQQYIELLKKYDQILGKGFVEHLDPAQYKDAPPINVKLTVDLASKQLRKIEYTDQSRIEELSGYGITRPIELPENPISRQELETKLQEVLTNSQ